MLNDIQMLNAICKNAQMGCKGIDEVMGYTKTEKFRQALETQRKEYADIYEEGEKLLIEKNEDVEGISSMAKISSNMMTMMKTMQDGSEEHLAEMMYQGSAMGVTKIIRNQREYGGTNPKICDLAARLLKTEENNMDQMRKFL